MRDTFFLGTAMGFSPDGLMPLGPDDGVAGGVEQ
jgi:hypothetical protein